MQRTRIYLIRHGQTEGHQEKRYNGQVDVPLTALGRQQSERVRDALLGVSLAAVYSSDLSRSLYCAELIAASHGLHVIQKTSFRELNIGDWEGRTWAELQESCPEDWQARLADLVNFPVPGGESLQDAADRIRPAFQQLLAAHPGGDVALVAHGGVNRIVLLDAIGSSLEQVFALEQDYGCLNIIDFYAEDNAVMGLLNSTAHLQKAALPVA